MRTVEEFEKATDKCQKPMSDYARIIVETDEKSPKASGCGLCRFIRISPL